MQELLGNSLGSMAGTGKVNIPYRTHFGVLSEEQRNRQSLTMPCLVS